MCDAVLYNTAPLLPALRTLEERASTDGDLTFVLPSGETVHSYTFLFTPISLDSFGPLVGGVRHITLSKLSDFQVARSHKRACQALQQQYQALQKHHYGTTSGDFLIGGHLVHRAFIAARIPYFDALFRGRFADSASDGAELDNEIVTPYALGALLWWCYIPVLPSTARVPDGAAASPETVGNLLDLAVATDYLRMDNLEKAVHGALLAAMLNGEIAQLVVKGISDRDVGESNKRIRKTYSAAILAAAKSVKAWKRTIVELPDDDIQEIIEAVDLTNKIKIWKEVRRLQEKVEGSRSKDKERWSDMVFKPLQTKIARAMADDMGNGLLRRQWKAAVIDREDLVALVDRTVDVMDENCCLSVWQGVRKWKGNEIENARGNCVRWFRRKWFDLATQGEFSRWNTSGFDDELNELAAVLKIALEDLIPKEAKGRGARNVS